MAGLSVKGSASVYIDDTQLSVSLQFTPDAELTGLDVDVILKMMSGKQINPLPPQNAIEEFIQKAAKAKAAFETLVAEGTKPEQPVPETVTWKELSLPEDIAPFVNEILSAAKAPKLFTAKFEKVKRERLVTIPSKIPFMPPKEDIEVTWEKKEVKVPVAVDVASAEKRYAFKQTSLGIFNPQKPGKPGKNVLGRPIPFDIIEDPAFLLGENLYKEKNEIKAAVSGILRIGKNWADLVPFAKPFWELAKGSDGFSLFLRFESGDARFSLPSGNEILEKAKELEAAENSTEENFISPEIIEREIQQSIFHNKNLEAFPLYKTREAEAKIIFSPRNISAFLYLRKALAGALPLQMKTISELIKNSGVRGFNAEQLKADISAFMIGPNIELKDYVLTEGKNSTRGADKEIRFLCDFFQDEKKQAFFDMAKHHVLLQRSFILEDYFPPAEADEAAIVVQDKKVAEIKSSSPGEDGKDVFGNILPAQPGNDPELHLYRGLHQHGHDIIAEESGLFLLKRDGNSVQMEILDYRDSSIIIHLSDDKMEAKLELFKEIGLGKPLKIDAIAEKVAESGLVRGIDKAAMKKAYTIAMNKGSCPPFVIAKGENPISGGSSSVKWLIPLKKSGKNGQIQSASVQKDTILAEIQVLGEEGRPGFDVTGTILSPEQGSSSILEHNESIAEKNDGKKKLLIAACSGELILNENQLSIVSLKTIKGNVGYETGSISFSGEIRIAGDIKPGYQVIGSQDILIGGNVESALVSSGGKVVISKGIIGAGKGVVRARKNIDASFAEQATLLAVDNIRVQNSCSFSNIKTNGKLFLASEHGNLIGGICKARYGVNAANIGSEAGKSTEISFGQDYLVKDQYEGIEREIEKVKRAIIHVDKIINDSLQIETVLSAARTEKIKLLKMTETLELQLFTLREKFDEYHEAEIRVRGIIYPGVVMESHGRYYEVKQKRSQVVFYFDRDTGRIQERPL